MIASSEGTVLTYVIEIQETGPYAGCEKVDYTLVGTGFAPRQLGGSGACSPMKILYF